MDCESDVFAGAAVRIKKENSSEIMMSDWTNLSGVFLLGMTEDYDPVLANALADSMENSNVFGVVETKPTPTTCTVRTAGKSEELFFGLDAEEEYYLSDEYPGQLVPSSQMPTAEGSIIVKVGQPATSRRLLVCRGERTIISEA